VLTDARRTGTQTVENWSGETMGIRCGTNAIAAFAIGALATSFSHKAFAEPITYTVQTSGTGSLGGVPFTDASVVFTITSDTINVRSVLGGVFSFTTGSGTVSVGSGPPMSFSAPISLIATNLNASGLVGLLPNVPQPPAGLSSYTIGLGSALPTPGAPPALPTLGGPPALATLGAGPTATILTVVMIPAFTDAGLLSSAGSTVGHPSLFFPGIGYPISAGFFSLSTVGNSVTFSATASTVDAKP
jgi:hypothetical protein